MSFDWTQQQEIDLGKNAGVDVSVYAKEEFVAAQMKEIRLGLEQHLDVSSYTNPELWRRRFKADSKGGRPVH